MKKLFLILIFLFSFPTQTLAQNSPVQEFGISPFLEELEVAKGGTVQSKVTLSNPTSEDVLVTITTQDFLPGDRGEALFIPDTEVNETSFSLASWITLLQGSSVTIPANGTIDVGYVINPPSNAEEGTHYGAILFSNAKESGLPGVGIKQAIGTIVLVSYGQAQPQGSLEFDTSPNIVWWNSGINFTNIFTNTGNVHVKPKGEVVIRNIFGKAVSTPQVNRDANNVLPKSDRTFISTWHPESWRFGRYTTESVITYGREQLEVRAVQVIWVLPIYSLIIITTLILIVLWFIFHGRHWHRKRVVHKHLESLQ